MDKPDWKNAPWWANYLAQDIEGPWWWYEFQPIYTQSGVWAVTEDKGRAAGATPRNARLRKPIESLEERP